MKSSEINENIHLITGHVQSGKTTFLTSLSDRLKQGPLKIAGFLALGSFAEEQRSGFTLMNLQNGEQIPLASIASQPGWSRFQRFYFNPDAFITGEGWIRHGVAEGADLVIIDEVGPLELEGRGWDKTLAFTLDQHDLVQIWSVRDQVIQEVIQRWRIPENHIVRFTKDKRTLLLNTLIDQLEGDTIQK